MKPSYDNCKDCPFFTWWYSQYGWLGEYPACTQGTRVKTPLDELDECPEGK